MTEPMWISPNYKVANFSWPLNIDAKITMFLDRTRGWQLDIADQCLKEIKHSGFAVLSIVFSYFEMIAKYQDGYVQDSKSKQYFKEGVYSVFPDLRRHPMATVDKLLDLLYHGVRCGLFHTGITDPRIMLTGETNAAVIFKRQPPRLIINPHLLVPELKAHFERYERQLRQVSNSVLRKNFEKRFDFDSSQGGI